MLGRKQVIIWSIQAWLGDPDWILVADWKPGTGAVVIDLRKDSRAADSEFMSQ